MLVEPRNPVTSSTQAFVPYKDGMSVRLPPTAVDLTRPMPSMVLGQNARNRRHHTSASLEAIRAVQEDVLRSSRARMGPNQEALQRLQNHSVAASAFTPTTSSLLRNSSLKYPPSGQNFLYGNLPSSPVKPSFVGHLPQLQASFSVPPPMSVPGQMLSFGYPPVSMVPPAVTSATYSPFIHMLSAAGQFLPFGYPAKKMFRCSDCRYMTDRKNNLKRHMATMHGDCEKVLECCDVVFKSKASLREHVLLFHQAGYRCRHCGRNFCRKALLKRHLAVHNGQKEYCCDACDYATSHKSNLERHRKVHDTSTPANYVDDKEGYLPEPEDLLNQQSADDSGEPAKANSDSFEDNSELENEEIEVSEVDQDTQCIADMAEGGVVKSNTSSNESANTSMTNSMRFYAAQFGNQSAGFDSHQKTRPCQLSAFDFTQPAHENVENSELRAKMDRECECELAAKSVPMVCSRCAVEFTTERELAHHRTVCPAMSDRKLRNKPDELPLKLATRLPSRKRRCSAGSDQQEVIENNEAHHHSKRWAFPTAGAEMTTVTSAPDTAASSQGCTNLSRASVITPYNPLGLFSRDLHYPPFANQERRRDHPGFLGALYPNDSVQKLRDSADIENKQRLLSIRKPAEQDAEERHGLGKEADQRKTATHVINGVDDCQPQSSRGYPNDDSDDKALPLKKRCVVSM